MLSRSCFAARGPSALAAACGWHGPAVSFATVAIPFDVPRWCSKNNGSTLAGRLFQFGSLVSKQFQFRFATLHCKFGPGGIHREFHLYLTVATNQLSTF